MPVQAILKYYFPLNKEMLNDWKKAVISNC